MKYVVLGSLGHVSKPLAEKLIADGHSVTIVSSNPERVEQIQSLGGKPAIGSVEDVVFLTKTFKGADAVYTMVPPNYGARDLKQYIALTGRNLAEAVKSSGVKNVVNLSSIGAHMAEGAGPVSGLYFVEQELNNLTGVNVLHLRAGIFYLNFLSDIGLIKQRSIMGGNYGDNTLLALVHPDDIADVAAQELENLTFKGKGYRYVVSDERTTDELAYTLGKAIGKPQLAWVDFKDEDAMNGMLQAGLPEELARNFTEMGAAVRSGEMASDYKVNHPTSFGKTKLENFAPYFAAVYAQPQSAEAHI
ncbi:MAG TPA: NAD-dependent dehydratase [Prolixibacteraceae bacterium]|nr:NAD-dependent dehydratase [Prolixibacteraceae bacterium]